ncbi:hypothetical protein G6F56_004171 [Rhizopus delemar]|nr:hypothetical protein G6F56_004171 [Rhizopus delemar]
MYSQEEEKKLLQIKLPKGVVSTVNIIIPSYLYLDSPIALSFPDLDLTLNAAAAVVPKSFKKLRGHNIHIIDDSVTLRARLRSEMVCFPNLCKKFLTMVSGSHLLLAPFFTQSNVNYDLLFFLLVFLNDALGT